MSQNLESRTVIAERAYYGTNMDPPSRLNQPRSLVRPDLIRAMVGNALAGITREGKVHKVNYSAGEISIAGNVLGSFDQFNDPEIAVANPNRLRHIDTQIANHFPGWWIMSASPWGEQDAMFLYPQESTQFLSDLPENILQSLFQKSGSLINAMHEQGLLPFFGINSSPYCINGKGLQSVLWVHSKVCGIRNNVTVEDIAFIRQTQPYDTGITKLLAEDIAPHIKITAPHIITTDNRGFTVILHDFGVQEFSNWQNVKPVWVSVQDTLKAYYTQLYEHCYQPDVLLKANQQLSEAKQGNKALDINAYLELFNWASASDNKTPILQALTELAQKDQLRKPFGGWAITVIFDREKNKTHLLYTFGPENQATGPVEGMGLILTRPDQPSSYEVVEEKGQRLTAILAA